MRRLLSLKDSANSTASGTKGKERQRESVPAPVPLPGPSAFRTPTMEVHVSTEVHSASDRQGFHPLASTTSLSSPSPTSSSSRPLPPEIRVPSHPYPYWQGYAHTPSSSSQSSLESPITPSHVSWLTTGNTPGNPNIPRNSSNTNLSLASPTSVPPSPGSSSSSSSLIQACPSPNPHFPPPPSTNPPPSIIPRPKLIHPTKSSHSLRVPVQESFNQQLSPIVEQDYFSPEKRPVSLPSSSREGGSRSSGAHTVRTSAALLTPVSPGSDLGTATVTPISPVPISPVLFSAKGTPPTPQIHPQTQAAPSYVPFARRKEDEGNDSPRPSPSAVSTFILRPLNRSISLSSTRTHQSSVSSVTPPTIPPLDLKPEFKGPTFLTTPTSLHSRGLLDVCARDDDSVSDRRESFVTARTGAGRESKYSLGQDEIFVDAEEGFRRDSNGTIQPFDSHLLEDTTDSPSSQALPTPENTPIPVKPPIPPRTFMHLRSASHTSSSPPSYKIGHGLLGSDNQAQSNSQLQLPRTISPTLHPSRLGVSAPSLQDMGTSVSTSSSFIDRRFAPSSLYLRPSSERESERYGGSKWMRLERTDTIQILFWLGFIAPWCWLIGGWLISPKPSSRRHGSGSYSGYGNGYPGSLGRGGNSLLPLWTSRSKSMQSFDTTKMQHGYPFVAPSVLSLTPPLPPYGNHQQAPVVLTPKAVGRVDNPWVRRCRIAAVMSGVLIAVAFLVALVVVGVIHG